MYASRGLSQLNFREGTKQWEKASALKDLLASFTIDNIRNVNCQTARWLILRPSDHSEKWYSYVITGERLSKRLSNQDIAG